MKVRCEVFRLEPESGAKATYDIYDLDADPTDTVLGLLLKINHDHDPTLSFRFACGVIKCGECGVMVNGTPCLACEKVVEERMRIEPLSSLSVVKDLVVDRREVFDRILKVFPAAAPGGEGDGAFEPEKTDAFVRLTKCFECCICQSACPVYSDAGSDFIGPLGLLWLAQNVLRGQSGAVPRDETDKALGMCLKCGSCSDACPCSEDILSLALDVLDKR